MTDPCFGPLHIDSVDLPTGGKIGLTNCPGRMGIDGAGRNWRRDLQTDLAAVEAWGASALVTLIERAEFEKLGVPSLAEAVQRRRFSWHHVPIADMHPPGTLALSAWRDSCPTVVGALIRGERVVFHCAAGLGRTGTIVAKLLVDAFGMSADEAIKLVRARRPGAIESRIQEEFVGSPTSLVTVSHGVICMTCT